MQPQGLREPQEGPPPDPVESLKKSYVKAMRTGEPSATRSAAQSLAQHVILKTANEEISGREQVVARITGQWPLTSVYVQGYWSAPQQEGDDLVVNADFAINRKDFSLNYPGKADDLIRDGVVIKLTLNVPRKP